MYKIITSSVACLSLLLLAACHSGAPKDGIPELKTTQNSTAPKEETQRLAEEYNKAKLALAQNPADLKSYLSLATVFVMESRVTGDGSYYGNAALQMLEKVTTDPKASSDMLFEAYSLKSAVLLNMHQFKDAFDVAQKGVAINSYNSGIYGALVDADVELGHYDSAVANCDRMLALRPDLRSYSRASYLRQIHGDNRGAIDAMRMAVEAGLPGAEQTEWARVTLGDLYFNTGHADTAALLYTISLQYRPGYPYALLGQARVARQQKQYDTAIAITERAIKAMSDPGFIAFLADTYELQGNTEKALSIRKQIIQGMNKGQEAEKEALVKHNANREMANAYLAIGDLDHATEYATADLRMRPDNIDANELMAWVLYRKGDYAGARTYADKMFLRHTLNAGSLYKAAAIYAAAGDNSRAAALKQQAMQVNPQQDELITRSLARR